MFNMYTKEQIETILKEELAFNTHINDVYLNDEGTEFTYEEKDGFGNHYTRNQVLGIEDIEYPVIEIDNPIEPIEPIIETPIEIEQLSEVTETVIEPIVEEKTKLKTKKTN